MIRLTPPGVLLVATLMPLVSAQGQERTASRAGRLVDVEHHRVRR
jgi:hypothetical protein